jgi:hypothetical protein
MKIKIGRYPHRSVDLTLAILPSLSRIVQFTNLVFPTRELVVFPGSAVSPNGIRRNAEATIIHKIDILVPGLFECTVHHSGNTFPIVFLGIDFIMLVSGNEIDSINKER